MSILNTTARRFVPTAMLVSVLCLAGVVKPTAVDAALIYQTAPMGDSQGGGYILSGPPFDIQHLGARFVVSSPVSVTAIGGDINEDDTGNGQLFGALVQLTSDSDFPDSTDLSTPDVLASAVFSPPDNGGLGTDLVIPIGPVSLSAGTYAVVFGSGMFGTTGYGHMAFTNTAFEGTPSFIVNSLGTYVDATFDFGPGRFTVYGDIPEPASLVLLAAGAMLIVGRPFAKREA